MPSSRLILSRRSLLALLGILTLLFGLAMLHPYPRQSLFGPTIRGEPLCAWESRMWRNAHWQEYEKTLEFKIYSWLGVETLNERAFIDSRLVPLLVHWTNDPDPTIRSKAIYYLAANCKDKSIFPEIALLTKHRDLEVKQSAIWMMGGFGVESVPILAAALEDDVESVRIQAIYFLKPLGPKAKEAIPALERKLCDESFAVRFWAAEAIEAIDPERFLDLKSRGKIK